MTKPLCKAAVLAYHHTEEASIPAPPVGLGVLVAPYKRNGVYHTSTRLSYGRLTVDLGDIQADTTSYMDLSCRHMPPQLGDRIFAHSDSTGTVT